LRSTVIALLLVPIIAAAALPTYMGCSSSCRSSYVEARLDREALRRFLESQLVPEVGLLRASVESYPDNVTIWIASDNLLASEALRILGSPLHLAIKMRLQLFGGGLDGLHEVLLGADIPNAIRNPAAVDLGSVYSEKFRTLFRVRYEVRNGSPMDDWYEYADLVVYRAIDKLIEGDRVGAEELFERLASMWNGRGFYDKASAAFEKSEGVRAYSTYKCALFIYLYKTLTCAGSDAVYGHSEIYAKCLDILSEAQHPVYGGLITDYTVDNNESIAPLGDVNTETTSIAVLALFSEYPCRIAAKLFSRSPDPALLLASAAAVVIAVLLPRICGVSLNKSKM